jgi:hypothetical protein
MISRGWWMRCLAVHKCDSTWLRQKFSGLYRWSPLNNECVKFWCVKLRRYMSTHRPWFAPGWWVARWSWCPACRWCSGCCPYCRRPRGPQWRTNVAFQLALWNKSCRDKSCWTKVFEQKLLNKSCRDKSCRDKSCRDKSCRDKRCRDKSCRDKSCRDKSCRDKNYQKKMCRILYNVGPWIFNSVLTWIDLPHWTLTELPMVTGLVLPLMLYLPTKNRDSETFMQVMLAEK